MPPRRTISLAAEGRAVSAPTLPEVWLWLLALGFALWLLLRCLGNALAWVARMQDRREKARG